MKKMICGNLRCEVFVSPKFSFSASSPCEYDQETVAYAVRRFFPRNAQLCQECTYDSWRLRLQKGKPKKQPKKFLISARAMQLPGALVRVTAEIDQCGVVIQKAELLDSCELIRLRRRTVERKGCAKA